MKKLLSLILSLLLILSLTVPVLATESPWEVDVDVAEEAEETVPEVYYFYIGDEYTDSEKYTIDEEYIYSVIGDDSVAVEGVIPYDEFYSVMDGEQATLMAPSVSTSYSVLGIIVVVLLVLLLIGFLLLIVAAVVIVLIVVIVRKKKKNKAEEAPNAPSEEAPDTTSEE